MFHMITSRFSISSLSLFFLIKVLLNIFSLYIFHHLFSYLWVWMFFIKRSSPSFISAMHRWVSFYVIISFFVFLVIFFFSSVIFSLLLFFFVSLYVFLLSCIFFNLAIFIIFFLRIHRIFLSLIFDIFFLRLLQIILLRKLSSLILFFF
jgi:hypothetical protein